MNSKVIFLFLWQRRWILLSLCVITPLGFGFKFYAGPCRWWFNDYGAGLVYEVFWSLVAFFFWPRGKSIAKIAAGVFAVTSLLEVLQLWHPVFLQQIRATFIGGAILGSTFVWWDFPHYALGCLFAWLLMRLLCETKALRSAC